MHVFGPHLQTAAMRELHPDLQRGRRLPAQRPVHSATPTPPTTPSSCRSSSAASTSSPPSPRRIRPTAATRMPDDVHAFAQGHLRGGGAELPLREGAARLRATSRTSSACAGGGSACPTSGTATTSRRSARRASASAGSRSSSTRYGADLIRRFIREWFDYSERRMDHAIRALPGGRYVREGQHDSPAHLPADPAQGRRPRSTPRPVA